MDLKSIELLKDHDAILMKSPAADVQAVVVRSSGEIKFISDALPQGLQNNQDVSLGTSEENASDHNRDSER